MRVRESLRTPLTTRSFVLTIVGTAIVSATIAASLMGGPSANTAAASDVVNMVNVPGAVLPAVTTTVAAAPETAAIPVETVAPTIAASTIDLGDGDASVVQAAPAAASASVVNFEWRRSGSGECRCTAEFPWSPAASASGSTQLLLAERAGSTTSAAIFSATANTDAPSIDDLWALLESVAGGKGEIMESTSTTGPNGTPTMTATLGSGAAHSRVNVFYANGLSYVVLLGNTAGAVNEADFSRFANSFQLA